MLGPDPVAIAGWVLAPSSDWGWSANGKQPPELEARCAARAAPKGSWCHWDGDLTRANSPSMPLS